MTNLNVVFDCSGSFCIRGKKNLLIYAFRMFKSLAQAADIEDICFSYFCWREGGIEELNNEEILIHPEGTGDYDDLVGFWLEKTRRGEPCVLMTDGCFDSWTALTQMPQPNKSLAAIILMGADADWQMAETCRICLYPLADLPTAVKDMAVIGLEWSGERDCI